MRPLAGSEISEILTRDTTKNRSAWAPWRAYGFICPGCLARYGEGQEGGAIDVRRCQKCQKTVAEVHQADEYTRSRLRQKVSRK